MEPTKKRKSSVRRSAKHEARLDFRLSREAKERIEKAALACGLNMSDFAASTLLREADEVLNRLSVTKLSDRDRDIFLGLLNNPPTPSQDLMQAVADYKQRAQLIGGQMQVRSSGLLDELDDFVRATGSPRAVAGLPPLTDEEIFEAIHDVD